MGMDICDSVAMFMKHHWAKKQSITKQVDGSILLQMKTSGKWEAERKQHDFS